MQQSVQQEKWGRTKNSMGLYEHRKVLYGGPIWFLVLPSKTDANKKRKIMFEDDCDNKIV